MDTNQNFYRIIPSCSQIKLSAKQLVQKLKLVKQKSGGTDNISSRELAKAGEALSEGLFGIFKNSIRDSVHPEIWKVGMVIPAFKMGIKSDRTNYRPLTMLSLNSKILESVVCDSLDNHQAFDTVEHTVLMSKLLAAGISGKFHDWLISYISDRSQYVLIMVEGPDYKL